MWPTFLPLCSKGRALTTDADCTTHDLAVHKAATRTRIIGTLIRIIGTLIRIIGTLIRICSTLVPISSTAEKSDDDAAPSDGHDDSNFSACAGARVCCWCRWPCSGAARAPACARPVGVRMPLQTVLIERMTAPIVRITVPIIRITAPIFRITAPIVRIRAGFELAPACAEKQVRVRVLVRVRACVSVAGRIPWALAVARRSLWSPPPACEQSPA